MEKSPEPRLRKLFRQFAESTSAHGISNIVSSTSHFWRLLWVLGTLTCFGLVVYQGLALLQMYLSKPVKSDFDVTYAKVVNFPTITICNMNIVKKSKLGKFHDVGKVMASFENFAKPPDDNNSNITLNSGNSIVPTVSGSSSGGRPTRGGRKRRSIQDSDNSNSFGPPDKRKNALKKALTGDSSRADQKVSLNNVTFDDQTYVQELMLSALANHKDSDLRQAGHSFEELVYRCTWNGFSCNVGDFKNYWNTIWNWRYGNCYMFNSGLSDAGKQATVLTSAKPGPQYGLTLDLFINQDEYVGALSQEAGVRVLLKSQRSIPFPVTEGFTAAPGFSVSMGVRKLAISRVDPFNNHSCWKDNVMEDWSIYKRYKGAIYSVQGCMYSCLARAQIRSCNCTQGKFRFGEKVCMTDSEVACVMDVVSQYDKHQLGCIEKCPQPCEQDSYRTTISTAKWAESYEKQVQTLMKKKGDKNKDKFAKDKDMLRENFVRVKIYFDELNLERITYREYYAIENLLGDVGGQMGLWIGISVLTLAEFLKLLYDVVAHLIARLCRNGQTEVQDINLTENKRN